MKALSGGIGLSLLLLFPFTPLPASVGAKDLVPPTRTLESSGERLGRLTVVSEPPDIEVYLDGSEIGRTPIWLKQVKTGVHKLRVRDFQADVYIEPSRTTTLSFFRDSFLEVPEERAAPKQKEPEAEKLPEARRRIKAPAQESGRDLTPWERFLNRTSPSF